MATAAQIQTAAAAAVTAQTNLETADAAHAAQEQLAQDATSSERSAANAAVAALEVALETARDGNPSWASTLAARDTAVSAWLVAAENLSALTFDPV